MKVEINNLSKEQKEQLIAVLKASIKSTEDIKEVEHDVREARFNKGFVCPHCGATHIVRHGTYKGGKQRYLCRNCNSTFSDMTNTPMSRTKLPDKWSPFIECMLKGYSLRKSASIIGVSYVTLFYWRHKLLNALNEVDNCPFEGIVEMDETFFLHSEKGNKHIKDRKPRKRGGSAKQRGTNSQHVCVLVARDRNKNTYNRIANMGRLNMTRLNEMVGSQFNNMNILCTDGLKGYTTFADSKDMDHYEIIEHHTYKGIFHIQNVNSYHSRLKRWIANFNGVSSKYLNNYLAWFKFLDNKAFKDTNGILVESCLHNTYDTYDSLRLAKFAIA